MIRVPAAVLFGMAAVALGAGPSRAQVPGNDTDIDAIITIARTIADQSLPSCYAAKCVKLDCGQAGGIWEPMLQTYQILDATTPVLGTLANRLYLEATSANYEGRMSQDQVDHLRDLQLLQDSIAVVGLAASEIASTLDLVRTLGTNADEWRKLFSRDGQAIDKFLILKDFKSLVSRIESFSKYPDIGAGKPQKVGLKDLAKVGGEAYLRYAEARRLLKSGDLTSAKKQNVVLSQLKDLLDLGLKVDRMARQARIAKLAEEAERRLGVSLEKTAIVRRLNERRRRAVAAISQLRRAINGLGVCYQRGCLSRQEARRWRIETPDVALVDPRRGPEAVLRAYYGKLVTALSKLSAAARGYAVLADYRSTLAVDNRQTPFTKDVTARFDLQRFRSGSESFLCIPENAELRVYRDPRQEEAEPVMQLGEAAEVRGRKQFRVQQDLSGTWKTATGDVRVSIAIAGGTITMTRKDTPVRGRDRVYTGTLKRRLSEPGKYTILFEAIRDKTYLPTKFEVTGLIPATDDTSTLYATPQGVDDLSPAIPRDIRAELLTDAFRDDIRYRASVMPVVGAEGKVTLKISLYNHRFRYRKKSRKVVEGSLQEKLARDVVLEREGADAGATRSRQ